MKKSLRWLNVIGLAAVLMVNGLAQWLPINSKTTGELSAKYPVLITPAPYALIAIYTAVRRDKPVPTRGERFFLRLPFSIYLGWICTAAIVNISVALDAVKWNGFSLSDIAWTVVMLAVASLLALAICFKYRDAALILVFIWSFIAIALKQGQQSEVALAAIIGAAVLAVAAIVIWIQACKRNSAAY
jgi:benzodiazapine receptor